MSALIAIIIIAVVIGILIGLSLLVRIKKTKIPEFDATNLVTLFDKGNVQSIDFIRNKIVVEFINIDFFDPEQLKEYGAAGISIVGDKIKFYIDGTPEDNRKVYEQLQEKLMR